MKRAGEVSREITDCRQAEGQISGLEKFPSENPNPVLRIAENGTLLYANPACQPMLGIFMCKTGKSVRAHWRNLAAECIASRRSTTEEVKSGSSIFSFMIAPVADAGYVNLYGLEVTAFKMAEERLQAKEKEVRLITDHLPALVSYLDSKGCYRYINKQYSKWFKISQQEIIGKHYRQVIGEAAYRRLKSRINETLSGHHQSFEDEIPYKSGGTRWIHANYVPDFDKRGKVKGIFVLVIDITQQKQSENAHKESQERFHQMAENIQEVFWLGGTGKSRGIFYLSPTFEKIWGFKRQAVYKDYKTMEQPIYEEDKKRFARVIKDYMQGRGDFNIEFRLKQPDGSLRWVWAKGFPLKDRAGKIYRTVGIAQDITERMLAEEALQKSEEQYRTLVENIPGAAYRCDKDRRICFISNEIEKISGYPSSDFIDNKVRSFTSIIYPKDIEGLTKYTSAHAVKKNRFEKEYRIVHKDGNIRWVQDIGRNNHVLIDGVLIDITERKQIEEELRKSQAKLKKLAARLQTVREEEQTRIARELHDEIGQALTAMKLDLSWINKKLLNGQKLPGGKIQSLLELIETTIQTVKRISTELRPRLLDDLGLAAAIEWKVKDFEKQFAIRTSFTAEARDLSISEESKTAIFRILQEALANVAQHAEATRVKINMRVIGKSLKLKIHDNGKGIEEKQISSPASLGLIGIRERVESLSGEMMIKGTPNKGTMIAIRIPLADLI